MKKILIVILSVILITLLCLSVGAHKEVVLPPDDFSEVDYFCAYNFIEPAGESNIGEYLNRELKSGDTGCYSVKYYSLTNIDDSEIEEESFITGKEYKVYIVFTLFNNATLGNIPDQMTAVFCTGSKLGEGIEYSTKYCGEKTKENNFVYSLIIECDKPHEHVFDDGEILVAPSCTEEGLIVYTCTTCSYFYSEILDKLDHDFVAYDTVLPTCTEQGYTCYICTQCELEKKDDFVSALGHNLIHYASKNPTCTEIGWKAYTVCLRCGESTYTELEPLGHEEGKPYIDDVVEPTCLTSGEHSETTYCTRCGTELNYSFVIDEALGHDIIIDEAVEPTCFEGGYTAGEHCTRCNYKIGQEKLQALGHNYDDIVINPTCEELGYTLHICSRCDDRYADNYKAALGHNWGNGIITVEPTEEKPGEKVYTCSRCGKERIEVIYFDHTHIYYATTIEPTCTEPGYTIFECSCGNKYISNYTNALGHDYISHEEKEPTCIDGGWYSYTSCSRCDYTTYKERAPLGHNIIEDKEVKPTCTKYGLTTGEHCTRCDYRVEQQIIDALGHDYNEVISIEPTCQNIGKITCTCKRCNMATTKVAEIVDHAYYYGICKWCGLKNETYLNYFRFIDMREETYWSFEGLAYCIDNGLLQGTSETTLSPEMTMTRAMLVTILYRLEGNPEFEGDNSFEDVKEGLWYYDAIIWAKNNGIVNGMSETLFCPNNTLTREQAAVMLYNYCRYKGLVTESKNNIESFIDCYSVSGWAVDAVDWAVSNGIIAGTKVGEIVLLDPKGSLTREQFATIMMRFLK